MNAELMRGERRELEQAILLRVAEFEAPTGLRVDGIDLIRTQTNGGEDTLASVLVDAELPR